MNFDSKVPLDEMAAASFNARSNLSDVVVLGRASMEAVHRRPVRWEKNPVTGLLEPVYEELWRETSWNLITNPGRIWLHKQGYDTSGLGANGLNYIALSDDTLTETAASTVLSNEIVANGLARAQGAVTLPTGTGNQTTIFKLFTCTTAPQAAQKAALFTAGAVGTMNHVLAFTERSLIVDDTLSITYTITLG